MTGINHYQRMSGLIVGRRNNWFEICLRGRMRTRGLDIARRGLHFRAHEREPIRLRRVVMHDDWRRDIWIGARRCDSENDLSRESRDCIVGLADHLDDDLRSAGTILCIDRAHALDRRDLVAEQRTRRNRDASRWKIDPELIAVRAQIKSRDSAVE